MPRAFRAFLIRSTPVGPCRKVTKSPKIGYQMLPPLGFHPCVFRAQPPLRLSSPNRIGRGSPPRPAGVDPRRTPLPVPPHHGSIGIHPRFRHPSIYQQFRHRRDEKRVLPGRHRPARCGNPNPTGRSQNDGGAKSEGKFIHPYTYNSDTPETKIELSRVGTAPHGAKIPVPRADRWLTGARKARATRGG